MTVVVDCWSYKIVEHPHTSDLVGTLNGLGANRWELVQIIPSETVSVLYLKRREIGYSPRNKEWKF